MAGISRGACIYNKNHQVTFRVINKLHYKEENCRDYHRYMETTSQPLSLPFYKFMAQNGAEVQTYPTTKIMSVGKVE